jgi:3-deoxy-manno-octulosonate cytidylyltransferase (CMP-KDO synthetase)
LATSIDTLVEYLDPNVVKVVTDRRGLALYFSRAPIPWARDATISDGASAARYACARRHIGLYAYRVGTLLALAGLRRTALESLEQLEQLRALEHGYRIVVAQAAQVPGPGVDTEADVLVAEQQLRVLGDTA